MIDLTSGRPIIVALKIQNVVAYALVNNEKEV